MTKRSQISLLKTKCLRVARKAAKSEAPLFFQVSPKELTAHLAVNVILCRAVLEAGYGHVQQVEALFRDAETAFKKIVEESIKSMKEKGPDNAFKE